MLEKFKKQLPNVLLLLLTLAVLGIVLNLMNELLYYSDFRERFFYLISIVGLILALILVKQLINMRQSIQEEKDQKAITSEFDLLINLLYRNQRSTTELRKEFNSDARSFITEINQFIPEETYQKYLTSLLEASHDLAMIESNQQKNGSNHKRKGHRRKNNQTPVVPFEKLVQQNYLVELGISELTSKKLISECSGQQEFKSTIRKLIRRYQSDYQEVSVLFDSLAIVLTFLNQKVASNELSESNYQHYISIVRNLLGRDDLLLVLVYALVIPEGCPLGIELIGSSLFGSQSEIFQKKYVDYPDLFISQLSGFSVPKSHKKSLQEQKLVRYYYDARMKAKEDKKLTKKELIDQVISQRNPQFGVAADFNYLQLIAASYAEN